MSGGWLVAELGRPLHSTHCVDVAGRSLRSRKLGRFVETRRDLPSAVLNEIVRLVTDLEHRWGPLLFRDVLGQWFLPQVSSLPQPDCRGNRYGAAGVAAMDR